MIVTNKKNRLFRVLKTFWRIIQPLKTLKFKSLKLYPRFFKDLLHWKKLTHSAAIELAPVFQDWISNTQTGGDHYFYQDIWALKNLKAIAPAIHYDIGSRYDGFVGQATVICPIVAVDIREVKFSLPNFSFQKGDLLNLPLNDDSINSISCLHTVEHIGLGRYGDNLDPNGHEKALLELQRVLQKGGYLILSCPIGRERIEFNAQRVFNPVYILRVLDKMKLKNFSVVTDENKYIENTDLSDFINSKYACGLFLLEKDKL